MKKKAKKGSNLSDSDLRMAKSQSQQQLRKAIEYNVQSVDSSFNSSRALSTNKKL